MQISPSRFVPLILAAACGGPSAALPDAATPPTDAASTDAPALPAWRLPASWRAEVIPFPLAFAPSVVHVGVEELRFPPDVFDVFSTNYWSYAFAWRLGDRALLDANGLSVELTAYYRGLLTALDTKHVITSPQDIVILVAVASPPATGFTFTGHLFDAFNQAQPFDVTGIARRVSCGTGALWVFDLSPDSFVRSELDQLAAEAQCGQLVPNGP